MSRQWGLYDRGLLRVSMAADVVVFDPDTIGPRMPTVEVDLPGGAKRFKQMSDGIAATVVNGEVMLRNNEHTGAESGQVLRGPLISRDSRPHFQGYQHSWLSNHQRFQVCRK